MEERKTIDENITVAELMEISENEDRIFEISEGMLYEVEKTEIELD